VNGCLPKDEQPFRNIHSLREGDFAQVHFPAFAVSPEHCFGLEGVNLDGFGLLGGGQRHSHGGASFKIELPSGEGMLGHFSLVRLQMLLHSWGLMQLETVCVRVGGERGVVS